MTHFSREDAKGRQCLHGVASCSTLAHAAARRAPSAARRAFHKRSGAEVPRVARTSARRSSTCMHANVIGEEVSPLRAARQAKRMSMEELAVKAGISRATLYWAEKAPNRMSERTVRAVARVLRVEPEELRP